MTRDLTKRLTEVVIMIILLASTENNLWYVFKCCMKIILFSSITSWLQAKQWPIINSTISEHFYCVFMYKGLS